MTRNIGSFTLLPLLLLFAVVTGPSHAFVTPTTTARGTVTTTSSSLGVMDPTPFLTLSDHVTTTTTMSVPLVDSSAMNVAANTLLLGFTDQGRNLAGIFFQASLLPYLLFLYWLSFRANRIPSLGNFGFQFVLVFVLSTVPGGVLSRAVYGMSLANVDWLHGGAETLLTVANVLIVLGFKQAMTEDTTTTSSSMGTNVNTSWTPRLIAVGIAGIFAVACATLTGTLQAHSPFLAGIGNIPELTLYNSDITAFLNHAEPSNALSIPTWAIHFSSVLEYLLAMNLVWKFADATGQPAWRGLTWGMLPLHASGVCACAYHWFYNDPALQFLVTGQAGLTLLGNLTCMMAAYRIAVANGWTVEELVPFRDVAPTSPAGLVADGLSMKPLETRPDLLPDTKTLVAQLVGATLFLSYLTKYGELVLDAPFTPDPVLATSLIIAIPVLTAVPYALESRREDPAWAPQRYLPRFGSDDDGDDDDDKQPAMLSMADVKKYGVSGTVAYVLTELAFWIVAFPVAATALYRSTGHWPDVVNESADRAAVLAFIFAGANIARLLVPVRLGAALALAPWVDENLLSGRGTAEAATAAEDATTTSLE